MNPLIAFTRTDIWPAHQGPLDLRGVLISFVILVVVLALAAALIWVIEKWIGPLPANGRTIVAIIFVALVVLWAATMFL